MNMVEKYGFLYGVILTLDEAKLAFICFMCFKPSQTKKAHSIPQYPHKYASLIFRKCSSENEYFLKSYFVFYTRG